MRGARGCAAFGAALGWRVLLAAWARIVAMLDREIEGVRAALPPPSGERGRKLKAHEDGLDSVIDAFVAI
jgi:hypothetical protein